MDTQDIVETWRRVAIQEGVKRGVTHSLVEVYEARFGAMPDDRKDGRLMLLWEGDRPVIGRWDDGRKGWEDPEGMHLFEEITYWADINSPE